jgi:hypothetical protein
MSSWPLETASSRGMCFFQRDVGLLIRVGDEHLDDLHASLQTLQDGVALLPSESEAFGEIP